MTAAALTLLGLATAGQPPTPPAAPTADYDAVRSRTLNLPIRPLASKVKASEVMSECLESVAGVVVSAANGSAGVLILKVPKSSIRRRAIPWEHPRLRGVSNR